MEIKFWYNASERKLIVIHIPSQERKEITYPKKIIKFLQAYQLSLQDCESVREDEDRLGLFKKMRIFR
ncbi:hypothetical protein [Lihuaxuella thermophila]|uniref:Uncharacterized protein n=1 Tax=Lihuaxuella thermophila TaxID=1173111 RepID=A0A1H8F451_9BACL|nr:hypothetical protein [Lihuaxuella thermophila]SEN26479.1 hypothetical protein SAMN05444955_1083 [Lihuaxuella thermophila]